MDKIFEWVENTIFPGHWIYYDKNHNEIGRVDYAPRLYGELYRWEVYPYSLSKIVYGYSYNLLDAKREVEENFKRIYESYLEQRDIPYQLNFEF